MLTNTQEFYGSVAKFFHWLIALLILAMLCIGFLMASQTLFSIHKITGLIILALVACRLIWTLFNAQPRLSPNVSKFEKIAARAVQGLLYLCMFAMPLSGWAMSTAFGFTPQIGNLSLPMPGIGIHHDVGSFFQSIHNTLAWVLIALIVIHGLGALKHYLIDKDPSVLRSMLPSKKAK